MTEDTIKAKFLEAYSQLLPDRERLIADCRRMQAELTDCSDIDREMQSLLQELEVVVGLTKRYVDENIGGFMFRLRELDEPIAHFDERLWLDVIDRVVVHRDGLTFKFQNGKEITV